ncbi:MAG: protein kinase [Myxococcota bacterium]
MSLCGLCGAESEGTPAVCPACGRDPLVAGRYVLLGVLGRGGTGVTWKAQRHPDGQLVCLKELRWDRMGSFKDEELFEREGAILKTLRHPQIPEYLDAMAWPEEVDQRHALWLAQELVDGRSLEAERKARRYSLDDVLEIGEDVAGILRYLVEQRPRVVHRDVKPGNIMRRLPARGANRRKDGGLVLVDFGAARASGLVESSGTTVAGTFGYMAPEQLRGEATPASDVYGLGMTLAVLFAGAEPEALLDVTNRPDLDQIAGLPPGFRSLLEDMLGADPRARPSAAEVVLRIRALRQGGGAMRVSLPLRMVRPPPPVRTNPVGKVLVLTLAIGIFAVAGYIVFTVADTFDSSLKLATTPRPQPTRPNVVVMTKAPDVAVAAPPLAEPPVDPEALAAAQAEADKKAHDLALVADDAACKTGDAAACQRLWRGYQGDDKAAVLAMGLPATLAAACEHGDGEACGLRGTLSMDGAGVPEDRAEGRRWYVKACDQGHVETCALSGRMLIDGEAGPVDAKLGVAQLQKACDAGDDVACMNIGVALTRGQGIRVDHARALAIFEKACRAHVSVGCQNLDGIVGNNQGCRPTRSSASPRWSDCAICASARPARAGDAAASGRGTKRDAAAATDFRRRACNFGVESACRQAP